MYFAIKPLNFRINILAFFALALLFMLNGTEATAILLFSALLHEAAHFSAIKLFKAPVQRFDLEFLNARIIYDGSSLSPLDEVAVSLSGPLFSLLLGICGAVYASISDSTFYAVFFAAVNTVLAAVNLLPLHNTDGGNALFYYWLWKTEADTALRRYTAASRIAFVFLVFVLTLLLLRTNFNISVTLTLCFCVIFTFINSEKAK